MRAITRIKYHQLTWYNTLWLWRWLLHSLSKRQSLSTTTVLFRTTFNLDDHTQTTYEMTPGFKPFTTDIFYWANKVHLFTACDGRELRRLWCCLIHGMFFFSARCIKNQRSRYKSDSFALSSISYPEPSGFLVSGVTPKKTLGTSTLDRRNPKNWYSVFTWRHGGHIGVPKQ